MERIEQLLQAAEFLERRERGDFIVLKHRFFTVPRRTIFHDRYAFGVVFGVSISFFNFQKQSMVMQLHFLCQMSIQKRDLGGKNLREIGK